MLATHSPIFTFKNPVRHKLSVPKSLKQDMPG